MTIDIIGAGIGGLTTSIALQQKGLRTRVFEQSNEIKPVGAGIIMAINAMQVYEKLGLKEEIEQLGNLISSLNVTDSQLRPISRVNLEYFEKKYGVRNIAIHRAKLQSLLASKLNSPDLILGHKLQIVERTKQNFRLNFENGKSISSEVLIGADGLNSTVRNQLFKIGQIRNSLQVCWRGVTEYRLPKEYHNELNEAWGFGSRFGFVKIDDHKVYWFAVKSFKELNDYSINEFESYFNNYHSIIKDLLYQTPKKTIHTAILEDLKPMDKWSQENVCLLGDAAHATTPNLGQGACQAIEDAYILTECLSKYEVNTAFTEYQRLRMPKAHRITNTSWTIGKIAHWENPLAVKIRNALIKMTPEKINRRQSENIFKLTTI